MNPRLCRCSHQQRLHTSGTGRCWSTVCGCVTFRPTEQTARRVAPNFLTVAEVAAVMRVSKMTVYRLIHSGELSAVKVRNSFRVPERALDEYVVQATADAWDDPAGGAA